MQYNEEAEVKCPYRDAEYACNSVLQEREIKAVSEITIILVICCCTNRTSSFVGSHIMVPFIYTIITVAALWYCSVLPGANLGLGRLGSCLGW